MLSVAVFILISYLSESNDTTRQEDNILELYIREQLQHSQQFVVLFRRKITMKVLVVFACVVLAINAATDEELWSQFKEQYGRQYRNLVEERKRFSLFKQALRRVEEHNAKYEAGESTYYKGINQFSDRSVAELSALFNTSRANRPTFKADVIYQKPENVEVADSVNWKDEGVVTEVKDQGQCGSCWAFSVTGALEGQYGIKYGSLVSLSEQDLMDCATDYGTYGCDGGWMDQAYGYVRDYGIESESDYPYEETQGSCRHSSSVLTVKSHVSIPEGDEDSLKSATASAGPISVSIYADTMFDYAGGVFNDACDGDYDHGVLVVGYGTDGSDYWLVKNSWGSAWGESGYMKIARNSNNKCSIASYATYPTIN